MKKSDISQDFSKLKKFIDQVLSVTHSIFQLVGWIVLSSGLFYSYLKFAKPQDNNLFLYFNFFCLMLCTVAGIFLITKLSIFSLEKIYELIVCIFRNNTLIKLFRATANVVIIFMLGVLACVFIELHNSIIDLAAGKSQKSI